MILNRQAALHGGNINHAARRSSFCATACGTTALAHLQSGHAFRIVATYTQSLYIESKTQQESVSGWAVPSLWCLIDSSYGSGPLQLCIPWPAGWQPARGSEFTHRPGSGLLEFPDGLRVDYRQCGYGNAVSKTQAAEKFQPGIDGPGCNPGWLDVEQWSVLTRLRPHTPSSDVSVCSDCWFGVVALVTEDNQSVLAREGLPESIDPGFFITRSAVQLETKRVLHSVITALFADAKPWFANRKPGHPVDPRWLSSEGTRVALVSLLGLGPGLTPSGDDFLAGLIAILYARGFTETACAMFGVIRPEILQRTNPVSAAHLFEMGEGRFGQHSQAIINQLQSVTLPSSRLTSATPANARTPEAGVKAPRAITELANACSAHGATSGWDFLAGAVLGLYLLSMSHVEKRELKPPGFSNA